MNPSVIEVVQKLCASGAREDLIDIFAEYCEHFRAIPLEDSEVSDSQALHDLVRENVILNGVDFFGHGYQFLKALRRLVETFAADSTYTGSASAT